MITITQTGLPGGGLLTEVRIFGLLFKRTTVLNN